MYGSFFWVETRCYKSKIMIPKKIFQSHKSFDYIKSNTDLLNAVNSWKKYSPEYEHNFFTDQQCDEFMQKNFKGIVYSCYKKLPLGVMKADLWRYCIIYHYGGIYADADTVLLCNPNEIIKDKNCLIVTPENSVHLCQWVFAAPPKNLLLKNVINMVVQRYQHESDVNKVKQNIVHYITGPGAFTNGIEKYLESNNIQTYSNRIDYYKNNNNNNVMYLSLDIHEKMVSHLFTGSNTKDGWLNNIPDNFKL